MSIIYLFTAVFFEVAGTTSMKLSNGLSRLLPTILIFVFYNIAFVLLALSLKELDLSMAYAIWSGLGTALTAVIGYFIFKENLNAMKIFGIGIIVAGIFMIKFF